MPLPIITSATSSCAYQLCEQEGHTVCKTFAEYYYALCEAAQNAVDTPDDATLASLRTMLNRSEQVRHDR